MVGALQQTIKVGHSTDRTHRGYCRSFRRIQCQRFQLRLARQNCHTWRARHPLVQKTPGDSLRCIPKLCFARPGLAFSRPTRWATSGSAGTFIFRSWTIGFGLRKTRMATSVAPSKRQHWLVQGQPSDAPANDNRLAARQQRIDSCSWQDGLPICSARTVAVLPSGVVSVRNVRFLFRSGSVVNSNRDRCQDSRSG